MKVISWNVNGLRAIARKKEIWHARLTELQPDVICLQETRCDDATFKSLAHALFPDYIYYTHAWSSIKKGYSGTAILSKIPFDCPVVAPLPDSTLEEGRLCIGRFENIVIVNTYTPNSGCKLVRHAFRTTKWDIQFKELVQRMCKEHNDRVLVMGDLNVAHLDIDVHPDEVDTSFPGYSKEERENMTSLLEEARLFDAYRVFHPTSIKFSWWSYSNNARERNVGWRIDYALVGNALSKELKNCDILTDIQGSDHAPVMVCY